MHSGYRWAFVIALTILLVSELLGLHRRGSGDTLTELYRQHAHTGLGAVVMALLAWLIFWHWTPAAAARGRTWMDLVTPLVGVAMWWLARRLA